MAKSLRVAELDFDTIKNNIKDFLRTDPTFTDFDFEGSGLSILVDTLAYNTHYNAIIANMLTQEMFLETATKRESVSIHAKKIGYIPKSIRSARATVDIEVFPTDQNVNVLTLGKGANFTSTGNISFNFINLDSVSTSKNEFGRFIFKDISLYEGNLQSFKYVVSAQQKKFSIPDKNADISLLKVYVQQSSSSTNKVEYKLYDSIVDVKSDTNAYFIQIDENGYYQVYFGDGIIGNLIQSGNIVTLEYVSCNGEIPNGASKFVLNDSIQGFYNIAITTTNKAYGGSQQESIESIRENSYKRVLTQNRAVTSYDYKSLIEQFVPVGDVCVWGGENNLPPVYGKVFISVLNLTNQEKAYSITEIEKQNMLDQIKQKMVIGVTPEFIDADILYVSINCSVYFDQLKTTNNPSQIKTLVINSIRNYCNSNVNKFNAEIRNSALGYVIDSSDSSILSNITTYRMKKVITPNLNSKTNYIIDFKNPIRTSSDKIQSISSNQFYVDGDTNTPVYIDDMNGVIRLYKMINGTKEIIRNVGDINYLTGKINLNEITINSTDSGSLSISCIPFSSDILSINNTAIIVSDLDISVDVISEISSDRIFTSNI